MRSRSSPAVSAIVAAAVLATPAPAQPPPPAPTPPVPEPGATVGRVSIKVVSGLTARGRRYVAAGQRVAVVGSVLPFVAGQVATLEVVRRGRVAARYQAPIQPGASGDGTFVVRFVARRRGLLRLVASHQGTAAQGTFRARSSRLRVVRWRAGAGARGAKVLILQRGLRSLGYATPVTGYFDAGTSRAVLAFRKANHLGWTGYAGAAVYGKVLRRRGRFRLKHPGAGRHVEFDWSRQLLVLADAGRARRVYHASSGRASTPTVFGAFRFYRKEPGVNSHGMVHSNYFVGAYAVHGYASVPTYPASHGCIRVPIANARQIDRAISLGERIFVYR